MSCAARDQIDTQESNLGSGGRGQEQRAKCLIWVIYDTQVPMVTHDSGVNKQGRGISISEDAQITIKGFIWKTQ